MYLHFRAITSDNSDEFEIQIVLVIKNMFDTNISIEAVQTVHANEQFSINIPNYEKYAEQQSNQTMFFVFQMLTIGLDAGEVIFRRAIVPGDSKPYKFCK